MQIEDIYRFFESSPPLYLNQPLAVCYVLSTLLEKDCHGSRLIQELEQEQSPYRLSETMLWKALEFLEEEKLIEGYWQKIEGPGRPRRMYALTSKMRATAIELAALWENYVREKSKPGPRTAGAK